MAVIILASMNIYRKLAENRLDGALSSLRNAKGCISVWFYLSRLQDVSKNGKHVDIAVNVLRDRLRSCIGDIYVLKNDDIVITHKGRSLDSLEDALEHVCGLFEDDSLLYDGRGYQSVLYDLFESSVNWDSFLSACDDAINNQASAPTMSDDKQAALEEEDGAVEIVESVGAIADNSTDHSMDPPAEEREEDINGMEDTAIDYKMADKQPKAANDDKERDANTGAEADLKHALMLAIDDIVDNTEVNLERSSVVLDPLADEAGRVLFRALQIEPNLLSKYSEVQESLLSFNPLKEHITNMVCLEHLPDLLSETHEETILLRLNHEIISAGLFKWEGSIPKNTAVILSIPMHEIYVYHRWFSREFLALKARGYKLAVHSIPLDMLASLDRRKLSVDIVDCSWSHELAKNLAIDDISATQRYLIENQSRVILSKCDTMRSLEFGQELGFRMYEGAMVEDILTHASFVAA